MKFSRTLFPLVLAFVLVLALACGGDSQPAAPTATPSDGLTGITLTAADGTQHQLRIEIADTREKGTKGLSGRDSLPEDQGMLFPMSGRPGFWMVATLIPLSAAFINDCGKIVYITEMSVLAPGEKPTIYNTREQYAFGLEANAGWFENNGIEVGDTVELPEQYRKADCQAGT